MATTECHGCGKDISVVHSFCPHCGASAGNIHKAAAGLEALVTLGGVVHEREMMDAIDLGELCRKWEKDCRSRRLRNWANDAREGEGGIMGMIAIHYWYGYQGVRIDRDLAMKWCRLAIMHGNTKASEILRQWERGRQS